MTNTKRAVLYCRLSKEDVNKTGEGDESESIVNQRLLLTDYAVNQGFSIVGVYQDDDYSGLYSDRPDFERLVQDAKLQKFDIIIAKTQSRFTRNMEHMEKYLHNVFPLLGIRFIGVVDNTDTANKSNKKSRQINGLINEWYCEDLSENIRAVFKTKMKAGQFLGSSTPYGYIKDPANHHHLIIDEYAADVVRKIFRLFISGYGKMSIGKILSSEGILIPTIYKSKILGSNYQNARFNDKTKFWSFQTILNILKDEVYLGSVVQNKHTTLSYKTRKKKSVPSEQWIKVPNMHEPIIDEYTWDMAQNQLKQRTRTIDTTRKIDTFSGKLFCKDCGNPLCRQYNNKHEFVGYHCSTYKKMGNCGCLSHSIKVAELEEIVLISIQQETREILTQEDIKELSYMKFAKTETKQLEYQVKELEKQRSLIGNYKRKSYESFVDAILTKNEYLDLKSEYEIQYNNIMQTIETITCEINDGCESLDVYDDWAEKFKDYINIEKLDRNIVVEFIDKIVIDSDGAVHINFRFENPYKNTSYI